MAENGQKLRSVFLRDHLVEQLIQIKDATDKFIIPPEKNFHFHTNAFWYSFIQRSDSTNPKIL